MKVNECCANCKHRYDIKKWDYSHGGCEHTTPDGFICISEPIDGIAMWMVGLDANIDNCECYEPKEKADGRTGQRHPKP